MIATPPFPRKTIERAGKQQRSARWFAFIQIAAVASILLAVLLWIYGPALRLPISLIDDETLITNSHALWTNMHSKGFADAIAEDALLKRQLKNPGYPVLAAVLYRLSGDAPYHGWKLISLGMVVALIVVMVCSGVGDPTRRNSSDATLQSLAALVSGILFLFAEVPGSADFNSLVANWFRLHTADSYAAPFVALHLLSVIILVRARTIRRNNAHPPRLISWSLAGMLSLLAAVMIKPTAIVLIGPLLLLVALGMVTLQRPRRRGLEYFAALCVMSVGGYWVILTPLLPESSGPTYASGYELTVRSILAGLRTWGSMYVRLLGAFGVWVSLAIFSRLLAEAKHAARSAGPRAWRIVARKNLAEIYLLLCVAALVAAYLPWTHRVPRYMLLSLIPLSSAVGIEIMAQWHLLRRAKSREWAVPVLLGAAAVIFGTAHFWIVAVPIAIISAILFSNARRFTQFVSGVGVAGFAYFVAAGSVSARAARAYYVEREFRQFKVATAVSDLLRRGDRVGFLGDPAEEQVGSIAQIASREIGKPATITPVRNADDLRIIDYLLTFEQVASPDQSSFPKALRLEKLFPPQPPQVAVAYDYWHWTRLPWRDRFRAISYPFSMNTQWGIYSSANNFSSR